MIREKVMITGKYAINLKINISIASQQLCPLAFNHVYGIYFVGLNFSVFNEVAPVFRLLKS
jgi:hypothetical protein